MVNAQRILPWAIRLLNLVLALALAWLLAWWVWRLFSPATVGVVGQEKVDSAAALAAIAAAAPFGRAPEQAQGPTEEAETPLPDLKLRGVFAPLGSGPGFAAFLVDGKESVSATIGAEIKPGVTLAEIFPQYVMVSHQGRKVRVDLEQKAAALLDAAGITAPPAGAPSSTGGRPRVLTGDRRGAGAPMTAPPGHAPQPGNAANAAPAQPAPPASAPVTPQPGAVVAPTAPAPAAQPQAAPDPGGALPGPVTQ